MNIDTEFNVGDSVCYLSGDNIIHTTISKIIIEISYADDNFFMVYKLSDGLSVPRNNYPKWDKRLFRTIKAESNAKSIIIVYLAGQFKHLITNAYGNIHENQSNHALHTQ